ncbi:uncharacterized protein LOC143565762 [Bidens hawaiensis]|uniref:uncharacterized protein LOC143565762 n=1 Tax=Bidens hawaiensis TaxID=980011 RepID=UPI004049D449
MAADAIDGIRKQKLWFPCKFFTINAASITLIAIAMKLPVDLTTDMSDVGYIGFMAKEGSLIFLLTMLANFVPSLGLMGDKELLANVVALGILVITVNVNAWIKSLTGVFSLNMFGLITLIYPLTWIFSVALEVPTSRRIQIHRQKEFLKLDSTSHQEINFSSKELVHYVKKYWMMAQTASFIVLFSFLERLKDASNASNNNSRSEMEMYASYIQQFEDQANLSKHLLRNMLDSMNRLLQESKTKEPRNLINLSEKSTGFKGVVEFKNDQVPPLYSDELPNSWSLVVVTLTAIAVAFPNIANDHVKGRENQLDGCGQVEVYNRWLHIELQKKTCKAKTSKEILQCLGDEAVKVVIKFKSRKGDGLDHSLHEFIAATSMYKISRTILLKCSEQQNWENDEELFNLISIIISDILCACFTNLPRVIKMKCHHDAIEERANSIWSAAQLLGRLKKILKARQLPCIDMYSMAYIDNWCTLPKNETALACASSQRTQLASSSSSVLLIATMV